MALGGRWRSPRLWVSLTTSMGRLTCVNGSCLGSAALRSAGGLGPPAAPGPEVEGASRAGRGRPSAAARQHGAAAPLHPGRSDCAWSG
jgi:hypothetical protein